jgi:hypothetical protein
METDTDLSNQFNDEDWIEFHKLTVVVISPSGQMGFVKHLASNPNFSNGGGMLRRSAIALFAEARPSVVKEMEERVWAERPVGGIALPTADDVARFKKL